MPKHTCQICSESFDQFTDFKKHMEIHSLGSISKANSTQAIHEEILENVTAQSQESMEDHLHQEIMGDSVNSVLKQQGQEILESDKVDQKINDEMNTQIDGNQRKRKNEIKDKEMNPHKRRKMFNFEVNVSSSMHFFIHNTYKIFWFPTISIFGIIYFLL